MIPTGIVQLTHQPQDSCKPARQPDWESQLGVLEPAEEKGTMREGMNLGYRKTSLTGHFFYSGHFNLA